MSTEPEVLETENDDQAAGHDEPASNVSLRDTIEAAVEEHKEPDAQASQEPAKDLKPPQQPGGQEKPPAAPADAAGQVNQPLKAPASWKPAVREKWNSLPREVQEEVLRREGDNLRLVGSVGQKIKFADEVGKHLEPFTEKLQANGASHSEFIGDIFSTVKTLASGAPQDKAEVIANIIQSYGIDLRTLDSVLTRRIQSQPTDPRVFEAQRRAQMAERQLAQRQAQEQQRAQETVAGSLQQFAGDPKNEFFEDVREMMADLIDAGRANTLEDAYNAAVWANPDTRKILLQREAEARVAAKHNRAGAARRASSSVAGAPRGAGGLPGMGENMSLRDTIAAAMDAQDAA